MTFKKIVQHLEKRKAILQKEMDAIGQALHALTSRQPKQARRRMSAAAEPGYRKRKKLDGLRSERGVESCGGFEPWQNQSGLSFVGRVVGSSVSLSHRERNIQGTEVRTTFVP